MTLAFTHDPDAGTLYCYFTELEAGQAAAEFECPVGLVLDAADRLLGFELDLSAAPALQAEQLELALAHAAVSYTPPRLTVNIGDEPPARMLPLDDPALLDLDGAERLLGVDLAVPEQWRTDTALAQLAPLLVDIEAPPELPPLPEVTAAGEQIKTGFVALVGKPNVGKSTLLNALLGQKVAIVSWRPQTTRVPLRGILNRADAQIVFIDTPGIHEPHHKLGEFMVTLARRAIADADLICFMVDISSAPTRLDQRIAAQLRRARVPRLLVLNKVDLPPRGESHLEAYRALGEWDLEIAISAQQGLGLATLVEEIAARLPYSQRLYAADQIADQSEQQLTAELVREKVLFYTQQEVPHAVAVEVEEWEEKEQRTYIRMSINVERESQKGILIGAGGAMLKRIGAAARQDIERLIGRAVYLDLWVKVRPNWRDDPSALGWLGYRLKDWQ